MTGRCRRHLGDEHVRIAGEAATYPAPASFPSMKCVVRALECGARELRRRLLRWRGSTVEALGVGPDSAVPDVRDVGERKAGASA